MTLLRPLSRIPVRTGLFNSVSGSSECRSNRPFTALFGSSKNSDHSGCLENFKRKPFINENSGLSSLGNFRSRLSSLNFKENYPLPRALSFRNFIHSGKPKNAEMENNSRPMDYVREILEENGKGFFGGSQPFGNDRFGVSKIPQNNAELNADIIHMKLLRNNTFVTLTDSKGNRKPGQRVSASAGSLPDKGGKSSRFGAEATAEHVGRKTRDAGVESVVVKVNGFTHFKKKRQAIMSFREGYTHSRGDQTPIVCIEDTTQRPHNGCRLPKKRRI